MDRFALLAPTLYLSLFFQKVTQMESTWGGGYLSCGPPPFFILEYVPRLGHFSPCSNDGRCGPRRKSHRLFGIPNWTSLTYLFCPFGIELFLFKERKESGALFCCRIPFVCSYLFGCGIFQKNTT